jgi:hypothetical protein
MTRNTLSLKRISILLIMSYIIFNLNLLGSLDCIGISFLDGMIKITETSILKTSFLFLISILILLNLDGKTETYIILLTNI